MKLESVKLTNFRGFSECTEIKIDNLTAFVGKNDVGKSTILEALDIFFNGASGSTKMGNADVNRFAKKSRSGKVEVSIACVFCDLPEEIVLDDSMKTTFDQEHMTIDGKLEIVKVYSNGGKAKVYIRALCPDCEDIDKLFVLKNDGLRQLAENLGAKPKNLSVNASLRDAIWRKLEQKTKHKAKHLLPLNESISQNIEKVFPVYQLFRADRENTVDDEEAQSPLVSAVKMAFQNPDVADKLNHIAEVVNTELTAVLTRIRDNMSLLNNQAIGLLNQSIPEPNELKWWSVYKDVSLTDENGVLIDKRGSGLRRLVLLSAFQTYAEERQHTSNTGIIYAIEEPETAQHFDSQKALIQALKKLSEKTGTQVLLTTHSGNLLKCLYEDEVVWGLKAKNPDFGVVLVHRDEAKTVVLNTGNSEEYHGVLPYLSYAEISYLFLGDCALEYHEELYGFLEKNKGLEGGCNSYVMKNRARYGDDCVKRYKRKTNVGDHGFPRFVRDMIHHPENEQRNNLREEDIRRSINMMRQYLLEKGLAQIDRKKQAMSMANAQRL